MFQQNRLILQQCCHHPKAWWEILFDQAPSSRDMVSLVGAGGKTTLLYTLATELASKNFAPAVATTTKIFLPDPHENWDMVFDNCLFTAANPLKKGHITVVGTPCEGGKLTIPSLELLEYLWKNADFLLLEADGSKRLPVKTPHAGEPVLWQGGGKIAVLCGLSCIGEPLGEICHRAALAQKILEVSSAHRLTTQDVAHLLICGYGAYQQQSVFVLNQADTQTQQQQGEEIAHALLRWGAHRVVVASFFQHYACIYTKSTNLAQRTNCKI